MPADMVSVQRTKEMIISFLRSKGPSLPVHIAREVKTSHLFVAAFLSELYNEGKLRMSVMKVGSSSLYYLPDQAAELERFIEYLNHREKESFHILKNSRILEDEAIAPVNRVAIRYIKDFAIPFPFQKNGQEKLFWRYFLVPESEAFELARLLSAPVQAVAPIPLPEALAPIALAPLPVGQLKEISPPLVESSPPQIIEKPLPNLIPPSLPKQSPLSRIQSAAVITLPFPSPAKKEKTKEKPAPQFPFGTSVKEYLSQKNITLISTLLDKKKEFHARVSLDTLLGQQHFLLIAKDKKRLKSEELIEALQKAHAQKLPALILAPGELEKKALTLLNEWSALIKFEKMS